jgi:hypothetical protein
MGFGARAPGDGGLAWMSSGSLDGLRSAAARWLGLE